MWMWRIIGVCAFLIGAVGLVLPVWPTTVFWIIAALAFARSNPAWRDWIYARPGLGPVIEGFAERGVLNRQGKLAALGGMALAGGLSAALLWTRPWPLGITLALLLIGALFVWTRREG